MADEEVDNPEAEAEPEESSGERMFELVGVQRVS